MELLFTPLHRTQNRSVDLLGDLGKETDYLPSKKEELSLKVEMSDLQNSRTRWVTRNKTSMPQLT